MKRIRLSRVLQAAACFAAMFVAFFSSQAKGIAGTDLEFILLLAASVFLGSGFGAVIGRFWIGVCVGLILAIALWAWVVTSFSRLGG